MKKRMPVVFNDSSYPIYPAPQVFHCGLVNCLIVGSQNQNFLGSNDDQKNDGRHANTGPTPERTGRTGPDLTHAGLLQFSVSRVIAKAAIELRLQKSAC